MNSFFRIIDKIKDAIKVEPFNNEITFGDIADIDLSKQSLFPLAHITVNNIFFMDLVDINNAEDASNFLGNDNTQDILNTQLALATRVIRVLKKADVYREQFEIDGAANCEPFQDRFQNHLAGWAVTFTINTYDNMTYC
mgnify:CR=1 FL=1